MLSSGDLSLAAGKMRKNINLSLAASVPIIVQNHRRLPVSILSVKIASLWSLKQVIGRILKISK
jgi:hypothetical protein